MTGTGSAAAGELSLEIVYALPEECHRLRVQLPAGATVRDALRRVAGLQLPEPCWQGDFLDAALAEGRVGIFGEVVDGSRPLAAADRIELYRPLTTDPKAARRQRAARQQRQD